MSRHPGAEFIPAAFLFPSWFIAPRVALIEQACDAWEDDDTYTCTTAPSTGSQRIEPCSKLF